MNMPKKMYDLSQPVYHNCPGWPTYDPTLVNWDYRIISHGFNAETVTINMHTGTHLDMPYHFFQDGKKVEDFPVDHFAGPCVVFDLSKAVKPDTAITPEDLAPHMDRVERDDIVILYTGYGSKRGFCREYLYEYPYLGGPAAELLARSGIKGVAIDTLSLGGMGSDAKGRPCHEAILPHEIFIIEEIQVPAELLDGRRRYLTAFPLLMQGCGGAPARVVVFEF